MLRKYCESTHQTIRRPTRVVKVGNIGVGGDNPIRIQSMTTSNTRDILGTIEQSMRLVDAGCEIVRVTVQGMKEAEACELIKSGLIQKGYDVPLVADIHFYPPAALFVADFVDKVRINPGNFVDRRATFQILSYDDESYQLEIEKIAEKFIPLIEKCKKLKRSLRIGANHGSLSDRIMNRFGDTPAGMVESALEFAKIARHFDFHDMIFSMKASNPKVMIQAYRLLAAKMYELGWDYPFHLGVTEAGEGKDGRVKSAMGIGALLLDGIGDTIRVSLTEDPWFEIDPCQRLIKLVNERLGQGLKAFSETSRSIDEMDKRHVDYRASLPLHKDGTVFLSLAPELLKSPTLYRSLDCEGQLGLPKLKSMTPDNLVVEAIDSKLDALQTIGIGLFSTKSGLGFPILTLEKALKEYEQNKFNSWPSGQNFELVLVVNEQDEWEKLKTLKPSLVFYRPGEHRMHACRKFFDWLKQHELAVPIILDFEYACDEEDLPLLASMECGALLVDGLGEGLWLKGDYPIEMLKDLSFSILQAARMRMSKTDFISCPSCGRTLFDLQSVTKRIQDRTAHLPGVKIAIMGCIVNGPGEMADADFGYVGSKPGKIDLYVGKSCVEKNIDFSEADDRLVALIKEHGQWVDPESV